MNNLEKEEFLLSLRPTIELDLTLSENKFAQFQNHTLRQILKMQNTMILSLCNNIFKLKYKDFRDCDLNIKRTLAEKAIRNDLNLKHLLFGLVVGQFTSTELDFYIEHKSEINKRLSTLIIERVKSQI